MTTQTMPKRKAVTFARRFQVFMHAVLIVLGMSTITVLFYSVEPRLYCGACGACSLMRVTGSRASAASS